jgi:hypothetical protein
MRLRTYRFHPVGLGIQTCAMPSARSLLAVLPQRTLSFSLSFAGSKQFKSQQSSQEQHRPEKNIVKRHIGAPF